MDENTNSQPNAVDPKPSQPELGPAVVSPNSTLQNSRPTAPPNSASVYPEPASGQMQVGMSASQMGYNQPKSNAFNLNPKKLLVKGAIGLALLGVVFAALVFTNIIALTEFKTVSYTSSKGTDFRLVFYTKHGSKQLRSGTTQLVSKVSKDNKFPLAVSIADAGTSDYNRVKDCSSFKKAFDVQSNSLNQNISVCDLGKQGQLPDGSVYVAGFTQNDQAYIITIGQDYESIDLSSQSGAQQSLARFGMGPYKADIETIVSSIEVE